MVAGDLVNTASRVQSAAEPGHGATSASRRGARRSRRSSTRRPASFELKGKDGARPRSGRRSASSPGCAARSSRRGSRRRSSGATASCGRSRISSTRCADEKKAHLVSVTGIAGIGKSRLAWEFYKYFDGIAETVYWHRGRCLSYGEGVTYWALADMVRMRCRIAEEEEPASAQAKLHATLEEHILDSRGARLPRAPARTSARPGRAPGSRPAGPLRRLAPLLRAPRRELSDGARLRGHAVGGREPARLRRVPARLVAEPPDLRGHARAAGAARAAADLGRRAAELHLALPGAALAARRWRSS